MDVHIGGGELSGVVGAIPSKSEAHRALICAGLSSSPTLIDARRENSAKTTPVDAIRKDCDSQTVGEDITATARVIFSLGSEVNEKGGLIYVVPPAKYAENALLDCGESGSTLRFMLPVVGALGRGGLFTGQGRLAKRPLEPLYSLLLSKGLSLGPDGVFPLACEGRLRSGEYVIDGGVSSQFISGLLFALPLLDGDSTVRVAGRLESSGYVDMTLAMLARFGVRAQKDCMLFNIPGGQKYKSPAVVQISGDWSDAAFFLCAGALSEGGVTVTGLLQGGGQGDSAVCGLLEAFGARISHTESSASAKTGELHGVDFDASDVPDLVPALSVVAAFARGETLIRGVARLRYKESDRVDSVLRMLGALGAEAESDGVSIKIKGAGGSLPGGEVDSRGDHRIAMAAASAAAGCVDGVVIRGAQSVAKSHPDFFADLEKLGGKATILK